MTQQDEAAQATHASVGNRLRGKVALVTGASSGIGRATVELFVAEGASVIAADINDSDGAALAEQYQGRVQFVHCDVTEEADIAGAIEAPATHFGGLDILFNNAVAGGMPDTIEEITAAGWDRTMALLLRSVALGIHHGRTRCARGAAARSSTPHRSLD